MLRDDCVADPKLLAGKGSVRVKSTKDQFVKTAIDLFKSEGYEKTTVERICRECGVTKGAFYHHFTSKSDVLLNYYNYLLKDVVPMLMGLLDIESSVGQLWRALEYSIDATVSLGPDLLRHMLVADIDQGNILLNPYNDDKSTAEYVSFLLHLIENGQDSGEVRTQIPSKDLLFAYISGLVGIALNWSSSGGAYDEKAELHRLFDIIFRT